MVGQGGLLAGAGAEGIKALPLSVRVSLFAALAVLALGALLVGAREQWREGEDPGPPVDSHRWWRMARVLLPLEAAVGLVVLISAAAASGSAPPVPTTAVTPMAGSPLLLTTQGRHLVPIALVPGLPGPNRVIVGVEDVDADGVAQPAAGVVGVSLRLACWGCGASPAPLRLERAAGSPWYAGTVTLAAATWSLTPVIEAPAAGAAAPVSATIDPARPGDLLVGVPADLSGAYGAACQNRAVGLELALAQTGDGAAGGPRPRLILDDTGPQGAVAATDRLAARGVGVLAAPCGGAGTLGAVAAAATRLRLPLVGALRSEGSSPYLWRTGIDQDAEGAALARQVASLGATGALLLVGPRPEQAAEAAAVEDGLGHEGVALQRLSLSGDPAQLAAELRARNPDVLVIIGAPMRALPLVEALGPTGWRPARGIVASSDLMSVSFVEDAGPLLRGTSLAIASELDPADAASRQYRDGLHRQLPLRTPGIEGARGYYDGLVVDRAAGVAGPDPSPAALEHALQTAFTGYDLGLFELGWGSAGGGPERLAFFSPAGGARLVRDGPPVEVP